MNEDTHSEEDEMKKRNLTTVVSIAFLLLTIGLLTACQPTPVVETQPTVVTEAPTKIVQTESPTEIVPSGQLIIAQAADINTFDPKNLKGRETQNVLRLIFDSLFHRDDNMQIIPWLAASVENPDVLTWRFHLRQDVKFSNGDDFKANDVKFTMGRLIAEDSTWSEKSFIDKVEVVDDYTVDIITKKPYPAFLTRAVLWHMTDEEYFNKVGNEGFQSNPVGTGPYQFVQWTKDEQVVLEANVNYWRGAPKIKTVIFKPIPETSTRIAALEAGDVNIISNVPPEYVKQPGQDVKIATIPGTRAVFIGMNVNVVPFNDVRVRQAMNYAVDVPAIIKSVLNGLARPIDNPLLPEAFGYVATPVYHYDPEKAKSLLADAGYPSGFEFQLDTTSDMKEIAEAISGQLSAVGIVVNINILDSAALTAKDEPGASQAYLSSWGNSEADASGLLPKQFYSKRYGCDLVTYKYPDPKSGFGDSDKGCYYTGFGDPEVDVAIEEGQTNIDPAARKEAYAKALQIIVEKTPWVFLYNPSEIYAYRGVEGWVPRADALFNLENASVSK
jgi:peptide/nickel transport system substrate-binding protein